MAHPMRKRPEQPVTEARPVTRLSQVETPADVGRTWVRTQTPPPGDLEAPPAGGPRRRRRPEPSPQARAVAMLARREHSQAELVRKLQAKDVPEDAALRAVARLAELGLQSDQRFLESLVRQRMAGRYGPRRAQVDLGRHGLDEDAVATAIDARGPQWQEAAYDLIERRFGSSPVPFALRNKAFALLLRRGFSFDVAQEAVRQPRPEPESNDG